MPDVNSSDENPRKDLPIEMKSVHEGNKSIDANQNELKCHNSYNRMMNEEIKANSIVFNKSIKREIALIKENNYVKKPKEVTFLRFKFKSKILGNYKMPHFPLNFPNQ